MRPFLRTEAWPRSLMFACPCRRCCLLLERWPIYQGLLARWLTRPPHRCQCSTWKWNKDRGSIPLRSFAARRVSACSSVIGCGVLRVQLQRASMQGCLERQTVDALLGPQRGIGSGTASSWDWGGGRQDPAFLSEAWAAALQSLGLDEFDGAL
jgi:hypothetical protein